MKKYIPQKMIENSRFCTFFKTLSEDEKQQLITKIDRLVEENSEYADDKNYAHLCNLLASLALVMILEEDGKTKLVAHIVFRDGVSNPDEVLQKIDKRLKYLLPEYMVPEYYKIRQAMPVHTNGKRDISALKKDREDLQKIS